MHRKNGSKRPPSDWVFVENAHPAIITAEEARAIAEARRNSKKSTRLAKSSNRAKSSPYILSGGAFTCGRCGANMTGYKVSGGRYYVCGSMPYRRGMGCGPGVYVPKDFIEGEVTEGIRKLVEECIDAEKLTAPVNAELETIWNERTGHDPEAAKKISSLEAKIDNVRNAIENGLADVSWANGRLEKLKAERDALAADAVAEGEPPRLEPSRVTEYAKLTRKVLAHGKPKQRKELIRSWAGEIKMAPEEREVLITYRFPEPFMNSMVAGAGFEPAIFRL